MQAMRTIKEIQEQIEKSHTIIKIETLILEAAERELKRLTTKEKSDKGNPPEKLSGNTILQRAIGLPY